MFISNAEKNAIKDLLHLLRREINLCNDRIDVLETKKNLIADQLSYALKGSLSAKKDTSKYYWRNKAERIAKGSKERINKPRNKKVNNVSENTDNTSV